jgi:hypothetical protein
MAGTAMAGRQADQADGSASVEDGRDLAVLSVA